MKKRLLSIFLFIAYIAILIKVMVFKVVPIIRSGQVTLNFGGTNGDNPANFIPFATILPYLLGSNGLTIAFLNLGGNIALLVPIGFLVPFVFQNITWKKALALGAITGLSIEIMQTVLNVGIFDIDDVILNAFGVMIGYFSCIFLTKWVREKKYTHILFAAFLVIVSIAGSFYIMYPHGEQSVNSKVKARSVQSDLINNKEGKIPQSGDLCGGTGGTGQIVSMGKNMITIKGRKAAPQAVKLTDQTTIRTSAGSASQSDLKIGDRVTVVIDDSETASTVLVCSGK